jgi:hemolysin activation/secretion protein
MANFMETPVQKLVWTSLALCCCAGPGWAAETTDAAAVLRLERDQIERLLQERQLRQGSVRPEIDVPAAPATPAASQVANIPLKRFEVGASAILSEGEIRAVLSPYEGRMVSLGELLDAVNAINDLYKARNMPTARAFLAPQEVKDGVVVVRLVEARVGDIRLDGQERLKPAFVRERVTLQGGDLMSVPVLENDLIRFNRLHETQLRASVKPGSAFGTTDVLLTAVEPPRYRNSVFVDNAGRYTVGESRLGVLSQVNNLAGIDDKLTLSAIGASGSRSYYLGYAWPITVRGLRADISLSKGNIEVVKGAFVPLNITGTSREISFGLSQPVVVDSERLWKVYGRVARKQAASIFGGVTQQDGTVNALTLGVSGLRQSMEGAWSLDLNLNAGNHKITGGTRYFAMRTNGAWLRKLGPRSQVVLRGGLQLSNTDLLPSSEQFQLGGSNSVRGYSEGLLSGRKGYLLSAEYRRDIELPAGIRNSYPNAPRVMGLAFVDHGAAYPYRPVGQIQTTKDDKLTSVGVGMQLDWGARANLRLVLGFPTQKNSNEIKHRNPRLHAAFTVNWP